MKKIPVAILDNQIDVVKALKYSFSELGVDVFVTPDLDLFNKYVKEFKPSLVASDFNLAPEYTLNGLDALKGTKSIFDIFSKRKYVLFSGSSLNSDVAKVCEKSRIKQYESYSSTQSLARDILRMYDKSLFQKQKEGITKKRDLKREAEKYVNDIIKKDLLKSLGKIKNKNAQIVEGEGKVVTVADIIIAVEKDTELGLEYLKDHAYSKYILNEIYEEE